MQDAENLFSVRRIDCGGMQGRGDPVLSRYHEPDYGPGLFASKWFWIGGWVSVALWTAFVCWLVLR